MKIETKVYNNLNITSVLRVVHEMSKEDCVDFIHSLINHQPALLSVLSIKAVVESDEIVERTISEELIVEDDKLRAPKHLINFFMSQTFVDWYTGPFERYICGDQPAPSKQELINQFNNFHL